MKTARILGLIPLVAMAAIPVSEVKPGERLPELRGESLAGSAVVLPQAAEGQVALLLLGFTFKSRFAVEAWAKHFRTQFQSDSRVTFYETPMIGGMGRLGKWFIESGMRRGTPREDYGHVVTVYRDADAWRQRVGFSEPDAAYLILLDRTGRVTWRHAGPFEKAAFQELSRKVSELED